MTNHFRLKLIVVLYHIPVKQSMIWLHSWNYICPAMQVMNLSQVFCNLEDLMLGHEGLCRPWFAGVLTAQQVIILGQWKKQKSLCLGDAALGYYKQHHTPGTLLRSAFMTVFMDVFSVSNFRSEIERWGGDHGDNAIVIVFPRTPKFQRSQDWEIWRCKFLVNASVMKPVAGLCMYCMRYNSTLGTKNSIKGML